MLFFALLGILYFFCFAFKEQIQYAAAFLSSATVCPSGRELLYCSLLSRPWEKSFCLVGLRPIHVYVYKHIGRRKAEEREMNESAFLLIAPAPPCWKISTWRYALAIEYEWGQYGLYAALCKWIIASGCSLLSLACSTCKQKVVPSK